MKVVIAFTAVLFSTVLSQECPPADLRPKRQVSRYVYPTTGIWFKDTASCKYYFKQGNSIYVQRNDGYYSKWVTSGPGGDYCPADRYKWTWDRQGRLYPMQDNCPIPVKESQRFGIPIKCLGGHCPDQARFPSGGVWHYTNCKYYYDCGDTKYELNKNGFYKKWASRQPGPRCVQICPDWWTWDTQTGVWEPVATSSRVMCNYNDPQCSRRSQKLTADIEMVVPPRSALEL